MNLAVCPGSFDPITKGHLDIIQRASKLFERVIVLVIVNPDKHPTFTPEERVAMIQRSIEGLPNVQVDSYCGLLADYASRVQASAIVKGLRAVSDFEYEFQMALINKKLCPTAETIFLSTSNEYLYLCSSLVRQAASFGSDITEFVPQQVAQQIMDKFRKS